MRILSILVLVLVSNFSYADQAPNNLVSDNSKQVLTDEEKLYQKIWEDTINNLHPDEKVAPTQNYIPPEERYQHFKKLHQGNF